MRVAVLSDTHMRVRSKRVLPPAALAELRAADHILHAGDIVEGWVLEQLADYAPVTAVLGNNDRDLVGALPETVEIELGGVSLAMIHDSGPSLGRPRRMARRFPQAQLVVFGHSHIPIDHAGQDQWLFNPGSPTDKRRQPHHTLGRLDLDDGRIVRSRIIRV